MCLFEDGMRVFRNVDGGNEVVLGVGDLSEGIRHSFVFGGLGRGGGLV